MNPTSVCCYLAVLIVLLVIVFRQWDMIKVARQRERDLLAAIADLAKADQAKAKTLEHFRDVIRRIRDGEPRYVLESPNGIRGPLLSRDQKN